VSHTLGRNVRTGFARLRTAGDLGALLLTVRAHGCPVHALVGALRFDERTVAAWRARAGCQGQAVQAQLGEPPRDRGQGQADARRVTRQGGLVWMALALLGSPRVWRAGEVREQRARPLIRRQRARVRACARHRPLLLGTEGGCASKSAHERFVHAYLRPSLGSVR